MTATSMMSAQRLGSRTVRAEGSRRIAARPCTSVSFALAQSFSLVSLSSQQARRATKLRVAELVPEAPLASATSSTEAATDEPVRLAWWEKPCAWQNLEGLEGLQAIESGSSGKVVAVEFFAGWCASCKASFPALCKIPNDKRLKEGVAFFKANAEDEQIFWWVKQHEIRALPYVAFFAPDGTMIGGMSSSFKKINAVKEALHTILDNPEARRFGLDPQGKLEARS